MMNAIILIFKYNEPIDNNKMHVNAWRINLAVLYIEIEITIIIIIIGSSNIMGRVFYPTF